MKTIRIREELSESQKGEVIEALRSGDLIIYPTDTRYAVGCDVMSKQGVDRLCRLKGISPEKSPLTLICHDISSASEYTNISNTLFRLLKTNTPGPFTFILKGTSRLPRTLKGRKELGIRIPDEQTPLQLTEALGNPLLSLSLDYGDDMEGDDPEIAAEPYSDQIAILIADRELNIQSSTIVDCIGDEPIITRQGRGELRE